MKRTPLKRSRPKPRVPMAGFWSAVTQDGSKPCAFTRPDHDTDTDCDYWPTGKPDAHHYVPVNRIKRAVAATHTERYLLREQALADPRNGVCLCRFHHAQVENARLVCPRPPELDGFLEDFPLVDPDREESSMSDEDEAFRALFLAGGELYGILGHVEGAAENPRIQQALSRWRSAVDTHVQFIDNVAVPRLLAVVSDDTGKG